jgi:hypothetical protein
MKRIRKLLDRRWLKSASNIGPDFAGPGINLYFVEWLDEAANVDTTALGTTTAFLAHEIKMRYPDIVSQDEDGFEWIILTEEKAKEDKDLKKIFLICSAGLWMVE